MKTRIVALAVAATLGLGSVSAFAQSYRHDGRAQGAWQHQRAEQPRGSWGYNNHRYDNRYAAGPRYYQPSYNNHRRDNGDVVGALVIGAIAGAVLGQATNSYNYAAPPAAYYAPPATYYNPPPAAYGYGYNGYGY